MTFNAEYIYDMNLDIRGLYVYPLCMCLVIHVHMLVLFWCSQLTILSTVLAICRIEILLLTIFIWLQHEQYLFPYYISSWVIRIYISKKIINIFDLSSNLNSNQKNVLLNNLNQIVCKLWSNTHFFVICFLLSYPNNLLISSNLFPDTFKPRCLHISRNVFFWQSLIDSYVSALATTESATVLNNKTPLGADRFRGFEFI